MANTLVRTKTSKRIKPRPSQSLSTLAAICSLSHWMGACLVALLAYRHLTDPSSTDFQHPRLHH